MIRSRQASSPPPVRFRLLAPLPLEVAFKSVTYHLEIAQVPVSGSWQLQARWPGGYWLCAFAGSEERLRRRAYTEGMEFAGATVPRTIFDRLAKESRAEVVSAAEAGSKNSPKHQI